MFSKISKKNNLKVANRNVTIYAKLLYPPKTHVHHQITKKNNFVCVKLKLFFLVILNCILEFVLFIRQ